jgi:hypothetical protein
MPPFDERFTVGPLMGVGGVTALWPGNTASVYVSIVA